MLHTFLYSYPTGRVPVAERNQSAPAPQTESTISGANWEGRDMSGEAHTRVLFTDLDMTEAVNNGAVFTECTFRRAQFNVSVHRDAAFTNCTFSNCSFFDTQFIDCKLIGSKFDRSSFDLMKVAGGNWSFVGLPGADLRKATFRGTRMRDADLTGARCEESLLVEVDLAGASLSRANFTDCDLRGSDLSALDPQESVVAGAIISYEQALVIAATLGLDVRPD